MRGPHSWWHRRKILLLVIGMCLPHVSAGPQRGELHELKDQGGVMESVAGWTHAVKSIAQGRGDLRDAFPVWIRVLTTPVRIRVLTDSRGTAVVSHMGSAHADRPPHAVLISAWYHSC